MNLVLYINGPANAHPHAEPASLLDRVLGWF